ncbi:MAG: SH3 domain-containing protein [Clostridiales bacterium]|nr:SH3 domain-containing protein [Clostridiales bacterium]
MRRTSPKPARPKAKEATPSKPRQSRKQAPPAEPAPVRYLTVDTYGSRLNLRDTGSRNGSVVARLPSGARVELLETDGAWVHVRWEDKTGWALATYLKEL